MYIHAQPFINQMYYGICGKIKFLHVYKVLLYLVSNTMHMLLIQWNVGDLHWTVDM